MIKNKIFEQGIGIAKKSQETRRDRWGGNTNPYFDPVIGHAKFYWSQNRNLWFTLLLQQSLLVSWLFLAIPYSLFENFIFHHSSNIK